MGEEAQTQARWWQIVFVGGEMMLARDGGDPAAWDMARPRWFAHLTSVTVVPHPHNKAQVGVRIGPVKGGAFVNMAAVTRIHEVPEGDETVRRVLAAHAGIDLAGPGDAPGDARAAALIKSIG